MKTPGVTPKTGQKVKKCPFASTMGDMKPSTRVRLPAEIDDAQAACDAAFAKACRYSGGRDLVEEMVASNFWPLGKNSHLIRLKLRIRSRVLPLLVEEEAICEDLCLCDAGADGVRSMKMMP